MTFKTPPSGEEEKTLSELVHRLRNNLTVVKGNMDLFYLNGGDKALSPEAVKLLSLIRQEMTNMDNTLKKYKS